jgi:hypothetical protein
LYSIKVRISTSKKAKQSRYTPWWCLGGGIAPTHSWPRP